MTEVLLAEADCRKCGETKPASAFYRRRKDSPILNTVCKDCTLDRVQEGRHQRRIEMGDEAYRDLMRDRVQKSRQRTGDETGKLSRAAYRAASGRLRDLHRREFERLLAAERYERGLP